VPARRKRVGDRARETLEADLAALEDLDYRELRQRFEALYGTACRAKLSRRILRYAVAYRMQEQVLGGLDRATRRRLDKAAEDLTAGRPLAPPRPRIKPGTRLLREWQGRVHEVTVLERGVEYRGQTWPSLSAVAREITGARWSGPRFFGLKPGSHDRS
jgi:hypothetical protein